MARTPLILSWSGGKDSALTLARLRNDPRYDVVALLTAVTREYDRISIHGVRRSLLDAQAAALRLPVHEIPLAPQSTNEEYEAAFCSAIESARRQHPGVHHVAFGDLFLEDVRSYRERLLRRAGVEPLFPLWGMDTTQLARQFVRDGFVAHLVCVDTQQLDASFAGRRFDDALLADLPASVDPCGERGEFHTFVSAGPIFGTSLSVTRGATVLRDERFAYSDLLPTERPLDA
ncbi:MAG: adenine nucleotide alpha hydrolase [Gemmatimonadetes bacterium]|nr:adenine nucleotide alpha hydrolase [Gemmatimonadota bacterium]